MSERMPADPTCACRAMDAYDCWRWRYGRLRDDMDERMTCEEIEDDGGPCECACHDAFRDDEDWA